MPTVLLVRHGRTAANAAGTLAGWTPGVALDDKGKEQAQALAVRLARLSVNAVVTSPLQRCQETADALLAGQPRDGTPRHLDDRLGECHYGDWTGRELKGLAKEPLWRAVQAHPSSVTFPGGESMRAMQARAVDGVRGWNAELGEEATWVAVSHGDVIKAVVADALGLHLDQFQRIQIDPCSLTVIRYTDLRPFVVRLNDTGGSVEGLRPTPKRRGRHTKASSDAPVGGGSGEPV